MSAKIPQDVTREDRLIGPLTLRQFLTILGGGSIIFIAYQYYVQQYLFPIEFGLISFVVGALTVAFTFVKINGLPFGAFMTNTFRFLFSAKQRQWGKEDEEVLTITDSSAAAVPQITKDESRKNTNESQLELLAKVLDTGGRMDENAPNHAGNISPDIATVEEPVVEDILEDTDR